MVLMIKVVKTSTIKTKPESPVERADRQLGPSVDPIIDMTTQARELSKPVLPI